MVPFWIAFTTIADLRYKIKSSKPDWNAAPRMLGIDAALAARDACLSESLSRKATLGILLDRLDHNEIFGDPAAGALHDHDSRENKDNSHGLDRAQHFS